MAEFGIKELTEKAKGLCFLNVKNDEFLKTMLFKYKIYVKNNPYNISLQNIKKYGK
ncbi:MAG TPA: hypothetical protein P5150_05565 [Candidatus Ratteibacteria bacterium]|nr:hypothetical protein [Candidatus Ratteibacteria bacterium]